jgi:beta-lactamase class A
MRRGRLVQGAAVLLALHLATFAPRAQESSALAATFSKAFASKLEAIASGVDGVVGYTIVDITSGERFERLQATTFPTASTIKLAVLYELLKQAEAGRIDLDAAKPLDRTHAVPGGLLYELTSPSLSPRDLAVAMIVLSDNTAANVLIDTLGMDAINSRIASLGLSNTHLRRRMIDLDAARRGDENTATPSDLAAMILAFHNGVGLSAASKKIALEILEKRKPSPISSGVPEAVPIASKDGDLEGVRVDAGIVYVPGRPYVFVVMGTFLRETPEITRPLEELARVSYDYFARRATLSAYGRALK